MGPQLDGAVPGALAAAPGAAPPPARADAAARALLQRDSFLHWLHYFLRFIFAAWVELPFYAVKRGKYRLAAYAVFCATFYFSSMWVLRTYSSPNATFWVFMLPMPLTSAALMCAAAIPRLLRPSVLERSPSPSAADGWRGYAAQVRELVAARLRRSGGGRAPVSPLGLISPLHGSQLLECLPGGLTRATTG